MKKYIDQFQNLDKAKKIKVVIIIALFLVVIYMVMGMFGGSDNSYQAPSQATQTPAVKTVQHKLDAHVVPKAAVNKPQTVVHHLSAKQKEYLKSVNQLQMLQLQQQIMQTKQQIAEAELNAEKTHNALEAARGQVQQPTFDSHPAHSSAHAVAQQAMPSNISLQYVANSGGKWQVIVAFNGQLTNATLGSVLPDGSKIVKVSGNSITLSNQGQLKTLSIKPSF